MLVSTLVSLPVQDKKCQTTYLLWLLTVMHDLVFPVQEELYRHISASGWHGHQLHLKVPRPATPTAHPVTMAFEQ